MQKSVLKISFPVGKEIHFGYVTTNKFDPPLKANVIFQNQNFKILHIITLHVFSRFTIVISAILLWV